jgi:hypothetical protein
MSIPVNLFILYRSLTLGIAPTPVNEIVVLYSITVRHFALVPSHSPLSRIALLLPFRLTFPCGASYHPLTLQVHHSLLGLNERVCPPCGVVIWTSLCAAHSVHVGSHLDLWPPLAILLLGGTSRGVRLLGDHLPPPASGPSSGPSSSYSIWWS